MPVIATLLKVIVCNVMTSGAGVSRASGIAKRLNRQLALYAKGTGPAAGGKKNEKLVNPVEVVKMNNPRAEREDGRAFDGLHLNARGYRAFTGALYDAVGPMMVSVEWGFWKKNLAAGLTTGAGGGGVAVVPGGSSGKVEPKSKESKKAD